MSSKQEGVLAAPPRRASFAADWSLSATAAGFLAVLVSYAGPLAIFFQAAEAGRFPAEVVSSWIWAISIGAAVSGVWLSWRTRTPVITAWSAPGSALLVTLFPAMPLSQVVGAYLVAAAAIFAVGWSGYFDRLVRRIPRGIAAGMMAGILFQFGVQAFQSAAAAPLLGAGMVLAYLVSRRWLPRYCVVLVLLSGVLLSLPGVGAPSGVAFSLTRPVFVAPEWSWQATLGLAIPLVIVSLTGQFLPGMAILRGAGYAVPARPVLVATSLASAAVACFGGITIVVAAITAALCTGRDAHEDPARRYVAGLANGVFYLVGGLFSAALVALFVVLPKAFVAVLAGLALVGAISANLVGALQDEEHREAAVVTFLATASGMSVAGLGSAFWGVAIGGLAYWLLRRPAR